MQVQHYYVCLVTRHLIACILSVSSITIINAFFTDFATLDTTHFGQCSHAIWQFSSFTRLFLCGACMYVCFVFNMKSDHRFNYDSFWTLSYLYFHLVNYVDIPATRWYSITFDFLSGRRFNNSISVLRLFLFRAEFGKDLLLFEFSSCNEVLAPFNL